MGSVNRVLAHLDEAVAGRESNSLNQVGTLYCHTLAAFQKASIAALAFELAVSNHHVSARQDGVDEAFDGLAFISAVVDIHVMSVNRECLFFISIEDYDVGVRTHSDCAFLWKQPEHFGGRC